MNNIIKVKWNTSLQDYKVMQNKLRNSVVLIAEILINVTLYRWATHSFLFGTTSLLYCDCIGCSMNDCSHAILTWHNCVIKHSLTVIPPVEWTAPIIQCSVSVGNVVSMLDHPPCASLTVLTAITA